MTFEEQLTRETWV